MSDWQGFGKHLERSHRWGVRTRTKAEGKTVYCPEVPGTGGLRLHLRLSRTLTMEVAALEYKWYNFQTSTTDAQQVLGSPCPYQDWEENSYAVQVPGTGGLRIHVRLSRTLTMEVAAPEYKWLHWSIYTCKSLWPGHFCLVSGVHIDKDSSVCLWMLKCVSHTTCRCIPHSFCIWTDKSSQWNQPF